MKWIENCYPKLDLSFRKNAATRQAQLTKPAGSLGKLENIAVHLAHLQQRNRPTIDNIAIAIFAGDHGVAAEGVSAFPQEVTAQMVMNFLQGGAAISVMAKQLNAQLEVIDTGIASSLPEQKGLIIQRAGNGTANMAKEPAMSQDQLKSAMQAGYDAIERANKNSADIFIGGEMGIANTTAATALYCALLNFEPHQIAGAGTGLDKKGIQHKITVIEKILSLHKASKNTPLENLRLMGGFEIAALSGAYIHAAQVGLPILVDGFISSIAALYAVKLQSCVNEYLFFSHISAEQGHRLILEKLNKQALLDLGMRLGEGSGAAVAVGLLQSACALHNNMATFEEAAVATKNN